MTTAVIVQARMGSSRLPGKVMMDLAGRTVLWHVVARCQAIGNADLVCVATSDRPQDEPVVAAAEGCGAAVYRGSEDQVLSRYTLAARSVSADVVLRVTCDCPLLDPVVAADVLRLRAEGNLDYAANNMPPSWPHGLDCEAFTMYALTLCDRHATTRDERGEFVTPWLRTDPSVRRANLPGPGGAAAEYRWTLDYPEDLAFLRALAEKLPPPPALAGWQDCVAVLERYPEIAAINRMHRVVARTEPLVEAG